jgi:hypothetical protein
MCRCVCPTRSCASHWRRHCSSSPASSRCEAVREFPCRQGKHGKIFPSAVLFPAKSTACGRISVAWQGILVPCRGLGRELPATTRERGTATSLRPSQCDKISFNNGRMLPQELAFCEARLRSREPSGFAGSGMGCALRTAALPLDGGGLGGGVGAAAKTVEKKNIRSQEAGFFH